MPFVAWMTFMGLFIGAIVGLTLLVHRQWAHHEQLRYPLAAVADALIQQSPTRRYGDIFSQRLFWWGLVPVLGLYALNYLSVWFPDRLPQIPMEYVVDWSYLFPVLNQSDDFCLHWFWVSYTIIGIAYFVPSDVGLSVGLTAVVGAIVGAQYYLLVGEPLSAPDMEVFSRGRLRGLCPDSGLHRSHLLRTGPVESAGAGQAPTARTQVGPGRARLSAGLRRPDRHAAGTGNGPADRLSLHNLRAADVSCPHASGVRVRDPGSHSDLGAGRSAGQAPGPAAVGPGALVFIYFLGSIFTTTTKQSMMPFLATGIKVADDANVSTSKFMRAILAAILLALLVGFCASLWYAYSYGATARADADGRTGEGGAPPLHAQGYRPTRHGGPSTWTGQTAPVSGQTPTSTRSS